MAVEHESDALTMQQYAMLRHKNIWNSLSSSLSIRRNNKTVHCMLFAPSQRPDAGQSWTVEKNWCRQPGPRCTEGCRLHRLLDNGRHVTTASRRLPAYEYGMTQHGEMLYGHHAGVWHQSDCRCINTMQQQCTYEVAEKPFSINRPSSTETGPRYTKWDLHMHSRQLLLVYGTSPTATAWTQCK